MNHTNDESPAPASSQAAVSGWSLESDALPGGGSALVETVIIGRGSDCDLIIDDPHLSRRHVSIRVAQDSLQVEDLGSANGTYLNGDRITQGEAHPGDEIRLDQLIFRVIGPQGGDLDATQLRDPDATALHAAGTALLHPGGQDSERTRVLRTTKAWLVTSGGERLELATGLTRIGRAPDNDLLLDDPSVSSHHAELVEQHGQWILTDLQSTNGTCLEGRSVEQAQLTDGARVRFGQLDMQFVLESQGQGQGALAGAEKRRGAVRRTSRGLWFGLLVLLGCAALALILQQPG
jgi:pSer/pThr/pTyr-binding forkhead associated (FHA) protein